MKIKLIFALATLLAASICAEVEVLPPDFMLFGKTSGDYGAEWFEYMFGLSTNVDYLRPNAGPLNDERVYFLQRPPTIFLQPGIQTYFVPEDVYVFFPFPAYEWDDVDTIPPLSVEELRQTVARYVDGITHVSLVLDGITLENSTAYRAQSPVFSVDLSTSDNIETIIVGHPIEGLIDPIVADGYLAMLAPLPAGLHDFRSAFTIGDPNGFSVERHFQIYSLPIPQWLAHQADQLAAKLSSASLPENRQNGLLATLNAVKASFNSEKFRAALGQLGAFQNIVRAQISRVDPAFADQLTQAAQQIINKAGAQLTKP